MSYTTFIKVAFFDLGGTLIGNNGDWIPGAQGTLTGLTEKQIRLGLISNTGDLLRPAILNLLPDDFDLGIFEEGLIIFSSEVDVAKPDPEIFRLAIRQTGVQPTECLFCTEESSHILVAQHEKMQTVHVRNAPGSDIGELIGMLVGRGLIPG